LSALPTTSTNSVSGNWAPALNNKATTTYTFTPKSGQCANTATMTIMVNSLPTANAGSDQTICSSSSVTLSGSVGGSATSGIWYGGSGTFNPNNTTLNAVYMPSSAELIAGLVNLTLTTNDPDGPCPSISDELVIAINPQSPMPTTSCYETATWNNTTCDWDVTGTKPQKPPQVNCWDNYQFSSTSCSWENIGIESIADCDGDGVTNGKEVDPDGDGKAGPNGTDPTNPCSVTISSQTLPYGQVWLDSDCDGDGISNGDEKANDTDPIDPCDPYKTFSGCALDVLVPEGFSPDGDGINDELVIAGIENYPNNRFTIIGRWGDEVYYQESYQNNWNGKANKGLIIGSDELPASTYFYILDLHGDESKIIKGSIYLQR
jgi:gliding motility-associated-like protein